MAFRRSISLLRARKFVSTLHHKLLNVCSNGALDLVLTSRAASSSPVFQSRTALGFLCLGSTCTSSLHNSTIGRDFLYLPSSSLLRSCPTTAATASRNFCASPAEKNQATQAEISSCGGDGVGGGAPTAATAEDNSVVPPRRFAILTTGHAAEYTTETYGGYGQLFVKLLSDPGEIWDEIFVIEGQFPTMEDLGKYDGFVITGSRHDAHGNEEWIEKLCGILQQIHQKRKKILGVCFGHQVLSRALGGKTGRAPVGWEVGLRDINLTESFFSKPYGAGLSPKLKVFEVHRDQVLEMPPGAELLASSERTGIEMYSVGEHTLAIQGHPEFFDDVVYDLLDGRLASMMTEEEVKKAKESLRAASADQKAWQQLCKDFLKGRRS